MKTTWSWADTAPATNHDGPGLIYSGPETVF